MKMSKEARIGLLLCIAVLVFFAGFYFLKGSNIFSDEKEYICYYDNVQGLQSSSPVQIKGLQVGKVSGIELNGGGRVKVMIAVNKKYQLPKGTVAKLISADLLGTKAIRLELGSGSEIVKDEEELPATVEGGMLDNLSADVSPLLQDVRKVVISLDSVLNGINAILNEDTRRNLDHTIASLDQTMTHFTSIAGKIDRQSEDLTKIIRNANSITTNLSDNNKNISEILDNANAATRQLKNAPIEQALTDLQKASTELQDVMGKINRGEGSAGQLVNDKQLYNNLNSTLQNLSELAGDLKAHPSRYINVTIFGRKAKTGE